MSYGRAAAALVLIGLFLAPPSHGETKVRVGQPQAGTFQFVPLQVGLEAGIFKRHGVEVEVSSFAGGPRVQQAIAAGSIDIGLGSGPELALAAKGAPEIAVAAMADAPYSVLLATLKNSPVKTVADLKGKIISISARGSLTDWLAHELSRLQGWGPDGFTIAPLGATAAQMAALKTHQIDGMVVEANAGYRMEEDGTGRVVVQFGDLIKTFHVYVIYARRDFAAQSPRAVSNFLAGWFDTVAYMQAHRAETIGILQRSAEISPALAARDYDELSGMFNRTGHFDPKALAVLARSFVEMGMLPQPPDMPSVVTERYLPEQRQ